MTGNYYFVSVFMVMAVQSFIISLCSIILAYILYFAKMPRQVQLHLLKYITLWPPMRIVLFNSNQFKS